MIFLFLLFGLVDSQCANTGSVCLCVADGAACTNANAITFVTSVFVALKLAPASPNRVISRGAVTTTFPDENTAIGCGMLKTSTRDVDSQLRFNVTNGEMDFFCTQSQFAFQDSVSFVYNAPKSYAGAMVPNGQCCEVPAPTTVKPATTTKAATPRPTAAPTPAAAKTPANTPAPTPTTTKTTTLTKTTAKTITTTTATTAKVVTTATTQTRSSSSSSTFSSLLSASSSSLTTLQPKSTPATTISSVDNSDSSTTTTTIKTQQKSSTATLTTSSSPKTTLPLTTKTTSMMSDDDMNESTVATVSTSDNSSSSNITEVVVDDKSFISTPYGIAVIALIVVGGIILLVVFGIRRSRHRDDAATPSSFATTDLQLPYHVPTMESFRDPQSMTMSSEAPSSIYAAVPRLLTSEPGDNDNDNDNQPTPSPPPATGQYAGMPNVGNASYFELQLKETNHYTAAPARLD